MQNEPQGATTAAATPAPTAGSALGVCLLEGISTCVSGQCHQIGEIKDNGEIISWFVTATTSKGQAVSAACTHTHHTFFLHSHHAHDVYIYMCRDRFIKYILNGGNAPLMLCQLTWLSLLKAAVPI